MWPSLSAWLRLGASALPSAVLLSTAYQPPTLPFVINTWGGPFTAATDAAYVALMDPTTSALDAVEIGCSTCERNRCDGTVGYGGSPDESCETTLDALIIDGATQNTGAVAGLRRIRDAISVARAVLDHTDHSMLAGDLATEFALGMGFNTDNLTTPESASACATWRDGGCQPNYRIGVLPDPGSSCGPYAPLRRGGEARAGQKPLLGRESHDTISMIAIDASGGLAAGTSTNGLRHKVPGRVGDGAIPGSGAYVDAEVGGCGATGDGDVMMRFLPCYQAVENMRRGMAPRQAAEDAVARMVRKYPGVQAGVVVVDIKGQHSAAASGWVFTYSVRGGAMNATEVVVVPPITG